MKDLNLGGVTGAAWRRGVLRDEVPPHPAAVRRSVGRVGETPADEEANATFDERAAGPVRAGAEALPDDDRVAAGAAYDGLLDLSGNVGERVVRLLAKGNTFAGRHGDGTLSDEGEALVEEAQSLFGELGDEQGIATVQGAEAAVLLEQGRYRAAERAYRRALEQERALGHAYGVMTAQEGLARVALAVGDVKAARTRARELLARAYETGYTPLVLAAATIVSECAAVRSDASEALRISRVVAADPATDHALARRAGLVGEGLGDRVEPWSQGSMPTLDDIVADVLGGGHG